MARVYLGLGSNLGDREGNIRRALELLSPWFRLKRLSRLYETEPLGFREQPPFLNGVAGGETTLSPLELLRRAKAIERELGRVPAFANAPRPIDIDLLFYDREVLRTLELEVPHPRIAERAFVLVPLAELAPNLVHPVTGMRVSQMLRAVPTNGVKQWQP